MCGSVVVCVLSCLRLCAAHPSLPSSPGRAPPGYSGMERGVRSLCMCTYALASAPVSRALWLCQACVQSGPWVFWSAPATWHQSSFLLSGSGLGCVYVRACLALHLVPGSVCALGVVGFVCGMACTGLGWLMWSELRLLGSRYGCLACRLLHSTHHCTCTAYALHWHGVGAWLWVFTFLAAGWAT